LFDPSKSGTADPNVALNENTFSGEVEITIPGDPPAHAQITDNGRILLIDSITAPATSSLTEYGIDIEQ
jgi:hypothetical protein